jgi:hypothetical protein
MKPTDFQWQRLARAARRATDARDEAAPYGFATRVAAQAFAAKDSANPILERFAWRALGLACLVAVLGIAANYSLPQNGNAEVEGFFTPDDPAAIVLEVS